MAFWTDKQNIIEPLRPYRFKLEETGKLLGTESVWWYAKSVTKPSFEISQDEFQLINHKIKFPGIVTWKDVTIKLIDYKEDTGEKTKSFKFYNYLSNSGYSITSPTDGISKINSTSGQFIIQQLDSDGGVLEKWTLVNAFIKGIEFSELSYEAEELSEITLTIAYDLAELT